MKKYSLFLLFSFLIIFMPMVVHANTINSIDMKIVVDKEGNAKVTEAWDVVADSGTEVYKPYSNLGDTVISNLKVVDESGLEYTSLEYWDIEASFSEKAYKSGINQTSDGIELNFGISSYGKHVYTMTYDINNFVYQLNDSQMIYFGLIPKNMSVGVDKINITISSDTVFSTENSKIWSFGYKGNIIFNSGVINLYTTTPLGTSEYMVALVKINNGTFAPAVKFNDDFDYYYDMAMKGATGASDKTNTFGGLVGMFVGFLGSVIPFIIFIVVIGAFKSGKMKSLSGNGSVRTTSSTVLPNIKKVEYFREIPVNKDLGKAYWLAKRYNMMKGDSGVMGAIILKWIRDDQVTLVKTKKGIFDFKDNNYGIDMSKMKEPTVKIEKELFQLFKLATVEDLILETKEFSKYARDHYESILEWFDNAYNYPYDELKTDGLINETIVEKKVLFISYLDTSFEITPKLREEGIHLLGLKRYLLDYSQIADKSAIDVKLWEEYLIFASIFGIAEKVGEQFSKLYPEFTELSNMDPVLTTLALHNFATMSYASALNSQMATSTGSGGGSFSGGGGGSFGGSSGGGFR